ISAGMDSFTLVELGAGKGLLAWDILAHHHFRYRILERSPALRMRQQELDVRRYGLFHPGRTGCGKGTAGSRHSGPSSFSLSNPRTQPCAAHAPAGARCPQVWTLSPW